MKTSARRRWPRSYSGDASKKFWARIDRVMTKTGIDVAYDLGLLLQETEARVLRALRELETKYAKR